MEKESRKEAKEARLAATKKYPFLQASGSQKLRSRVYVMDESLADALAKSVRKNQTDQDALILEANPGSGVLTKALMKAGAEKFVLTESMKEFMPCLQELQEKNKTRILAVYNWDLLSSWHRVGKAEKANQEFGTELLRHVPHRKWTDGPPVTVVAVLPHKKEYEFLIHLVLSYAHQQSIYGMGRPEWFLTFSANTYMKLLVSKMDHPQSSFYTPLGIMLHVIYDPQLCAELPSWMFMPSFPEKRHENQRSLNISNSVRYLMRLQPRKKPELMFSEVPMFYNFLRQVMRRKRDRLVLKMEQLVPGCGVHLIMLHFTMSMLVSNVSAAQFIVIFKAMQTWPEYRGSPLCQHLTDSASLSPDETAENTQKQN